MPEAVSERESKILAIIETARAKRPKFRDPHITMSHGAGGKATSALIEGLFVPAFASPSLDALADAGAVGVEGIELALTTDSFVVKPLRFPGGSIGELAVNGTVNDLAMAGARPLALTLSLVLEEGLSAETLRAEVDAIACAAQRGRCRRSSPATRRSSNAATPTGSTSARPVSAGATRAPRSAPIVSNPGDRILRLRLDRRARHRDHARARRARSGRRHRVRHALAVARGRRPARRRRTRAALPARRHARRRRIRAQRARARLGRGDGRARGRRSRRAGGRRRRRDPRDRPDVRRQRGQVRRVRRARARRAGARRTARRARAARPPRRSARSRPSRPGWCSSRPRSAGVA